MSFLEAGRAVDGDAGTDEVKGAKALDAFEENAEGAAKFKAAGMRSFEENLLFAAAGDLAPGRVIVDRANYWAALPPPRSASEMMWTEPRSPNGAKA